MGEGGGFLWLVTIDKIFPVVPLAPMDVMVHVIGAFFSDPPPGPSFQGLE